MSPIHRFLSTMPKTHFLKLVVAILVCVSPACQCDVKSARPTDATLHVIVSSAPESLDPRFATSAVASNVSQLIFSPLFYIGEDLLPAPLLANDLEQINPVTYQVHLRPNLYFHDGSPLTADDVVYSFLALGDSDVKSPHAEKFVYLKDVTALSEHTIRFTLKEPFAPFLIDLCGISIVSRKHCQNRSGECRHDPVGSGPFRLKNYNKVTETIVLAPHPKWFEGPPPLEQIEIRVVRDGTTRLLELIKGKADFNSGNVSPTQLQVIEQYRERLIIKRAPGLGYAYLAMNLRGPKNRGQIPESDLDRTRRALADARVRRAIASAIDVRTILKEKFHGMATRASGMIPPYHWAKSPELLPFEYEPAKAKALLDEAGFLDRGKNKGSRFKLTISTTTDRFRQSIALVYADQLRAVGIDAHIRVQDWGALYQDIKQGSFEMFSAIWVPVVDPDLMHWVFHSSNIPGTDKGGGNRGAYVDSIVDEWLAEARTTIPLDKRKTQYDLVEIRLQETMPYIPLWFEDEIVVMNRDVVDFTPSRTGSLLGLRHTRLERIREENES